MAADQDFVTKEELGYILKDVGTRITRLEDDLARFRDVNMTNVEKDLKSAAAHLAVLSSQVMELKDIQKAHSKTMATFNWWLIGTFISVIMFLGQSLVQSLSVP